MASEDSEGAFLLRPFLLIVRTRRIVTAFARSSAGYSEFPAYSRVLCEPLPIRRATKLSNLRTVHRCCSTIFAIARTTLVGRGHFCRALHVAMQIGLYHPFLFRNGLACSL